MTQITTTAQVTALKKGQTITRVIQMNGYELTDTATVISNRGGNVKMQYADTVVATGMRLDLAHLSWFLA
jgi:hypothetical protein